MSNSQVPVVSQTTFNDGAIHEIDYTADGHEVAAFAIHGSPAQSVLYALLELVPRKPALCISGINFGENVGSWVTSSGTVGAAMEAANEGVAALAVSLETDKQYHYQHSEVVDLSTAAGFCRHFAARMLAQTMPFDVDLLKVDIPSNATAETPWRLTRLSRQRYCQPLPSGRRNLGEKRRLDYEIAIDHSTLEPDSDVHAPFCGSRRGGCTLEPGLDLANKLRGVGSGATLRQCLAAATSAA